MGWGGGSALAPGQQGLKGPVAPSGPAELWPPLASPSQVGTEDPHTGEQTGWGLPFCQTFHPRKTRRVDRQTHRHIFKDTQTWKLWDEGLAHPLSDPHCPGNSPLPDPAETGTGVGVHSSAALLLLQPGL